MKKPPSDNPLISTHRRLAHADDLRKKGQLEQAAKICEDLLRSYPDYVAALHTLGLVQIEQRSYWAALSSFIRAAMLNPKDWTILINLCNVYLALGADEMAAHTLEQVLALKDDDATIHFSLAQIYESRREYELAVEAFKNSLALDAGNAAAWQMLGRCLIHLGQAREAAEALRNAFERDPDSVAPLYHMGQLPPSLVEVDVLEAIDGISEEAKRRDPEFDIRVNFARAGALHNAGRYEEAWQCLMRANRAVARQYDDDRQARRERRNSEAMALARQRPATVRGDRGGDAPLPVSLFILGPSRSGKTTMEKLMARVAGVKRGYENMIVEDSVRRASQLSGLLTIDTLLQLPNNLDARFAEIYAEELRRRAGNSVVFTNTHPGRLIDVGRLAEAIPNARFVFMKRNVDDMAFRIFTKHYRHESNIYAYDIKNIYEHIEWYNEMIDIWLEKFDRISKCICYEEMIENPRFALTQTASLCGVSDENVKKLAAGDDRRCAGPYKNFLRKERGQK